MKYTVLRVLKSTLKETETNEQVCTWFRDSKFGKRTVEGTRSLFNNGHLVPVAIVEADNEEDLFDKTNTVHRMWLDNPEVTKLPMHSIAATNSSSVGDVHITENGVYRVCLAFGFADLFPSTK